MLKKAGFIALPLIVLAGMRRCPQMHMECMGCKSLADVLPGVLILSSVIAVFAVAALAVFNRRQAL
jgi:multisubunit Na+/H+ antiporter MnhC subunit